MALNIAALLQNNPEYQARERSFQSKSWYPAFQQAYASGDPNQVIAFAQSVGPQYPDFDASSGEYVGTTVAQMQHGKSDPTIAGIKVSPKVYNAVSDAIPYVATALVGGGAMAGAGAGAGAAGDAALAGGGEVGSGYAASAPGAAGGVTGGTTAAVGGDVLSGGGGTNALTSAGTVPAGAFDLGGGMTVDAYGNVVGGTAGAGGVGTAAGAGGYDLGSGMTVDASGNVAGATGATGGAATDGILGMNPQLLGAGAGALIGGLGGGSKPAGTTTSTQDVPPWLMPYVTGNLNAATGARDSLIASPDTTTAAIPEYMKTIRGDYLNPASNPYLDATYKHAAGLVGAGVDSKFEASGRYGSGAHQGVLQEGFDNLATSIYGGNYQAERARQVAAVTGAPAFDTGTATAAFAPYSQYASLFPGKSTSTTTPYFTNTAGGILGGALAGSQLMRMYG